MITLKNEALIVEISDKGAEMTSIRDAKTGYEYLWQGDPDYWARQSPVLFPNVGKLKNNQYTFQGQSYEIGQHGFARDMTFTLQMETSNSATFNLKSSPETLEVYPFEFSFQITYILDENQITISYEILNPSNQVIYYSVGAHPAFNVHQKRDQSSQLDFNQVKLSFDPASHYLRIPLTKKGLIDKANAKYEPIDERVLSHKDFKKDALIYQIGNQTQVSLIDEIQEVEFKIRSNRMPFVGIWSPYPKRAGFICIEPWAGIADDVSHNGDFTEKYGSQSLEPHEIRTHDFTIDIIKLDI
ncbi:aldose 1-epimerase family protein [Aerococcaceae bacterium DSM 111020]|nr:aldose 1-epimerase family protein [Aerococcaceae bacterium DSM 111020]